MVTYAESPEGHPLINGAQITQLITDDAIKCGGCNFRCSVFYALVGQNAHPYTGDAEQDGDDPTGMCAECFLEWLREIGAKISV